MYYEAEKRNYIGGVTPPIKVNIFKQADTSSNSGKKHEGSITSVVFCQKILAWSTKSRIMIRYYPKTMDKKGSNICQIESPIKIDENILDSYP